MWLGVPAADNIGIDGCKFLVGEAMPSHANYSVTNQLVNPVLLDQLAIFFPKRSGTHRSQVVDHFPFHDICQVTTPDPCTGIERVDDGLIINPIPLQV